MRELQAFEVRQPLIFFGCTSELIYRSIHPWQTVVVTGFDCTGKQCNTVNARYVASIRQRKITMITGEKVPAPTRSYGAIKKELERKMNGLETERADLNQP